MTLSKIEWTDTTWNPVTGCTKVSPGCDRCYAERFAERFRDLSGHSYESGFDLTLRPERLTQPGKWRKPRMVFVNSMSDLFHADIPDAYIDRVFSVMENESRHVFQVLTKRSGRMLRYLGRRYHGRAVPPKNVWMGVSIEDRDRMVRARHLVRAPAAVKFLSIEPILESLMPDLQRAEWGGLIDWIIVGGESGPGARWPSPQWIVEIRDYCDRAGIKFFFKQWGGTFPKQNGRILDGRTHDDMPAWPGAAP